MPGKAKKPFIDKKKSVTFRLVHRSLKDPLAADDEAPQHVLLPYGGKQKIPDSVSEPGTYKYEEMISERKKFGIGFEDDYDYFQHLKVSQKSQPAILVPTHGLVEIEEGNDGMSEVLRDNEPILKLPSEVFGSTVEEDVGLLFRAIPPTGPQPSWDPDIVAGIDDDFDFENPDNQLADDFVFTASQPAEGEELTDDDFEESDVDSDCFAIEETKSQFTNYSLTSSVIRRNEQLSLLDDKFERFFESYEDANIGDLAQTEIEGGFPVDDVNRVEGMTVLLGLKDRRRLPVTLDDHDKPEWNKHYKYNPDDEVSVEEELVTMVKEEPERKWDCESILSAYSTLYNHPKLIEEPARKVKFSKKTGLPVDERPKLTKQQLRLLDDEPPHPPEPAHPPRMKGETKEEKQLRKKAIKESRKERRLQKKATKAAFREEKRRQTQELINIRQNLTGIKIS